MKKTVGKGYAAERRKRSLAILMIWCLIGAVMPVSVRAESGAGESGTSGYSKYVNDDIYTRTGWNFEMTGQPQNNVTVRTINLDPAVLRPKDGTWDTYYSSSTGRENIVYFGKWRDRSGEYRVLSSPNTQSCTEECLLLDNACLVKCMAFDADGVANTGQTAPNAWAGSDLESWLNGEDFYKSESAFSNLERAAIAKTTLSGFDEYAIDGVGEYQDYSAEDYVFCLSMAEVEGLYVGGCRGSNLAKWAFENEDFSEWYWLRSVSESSNDSDVVCVQQRGSLQSVEAAVTDEYGVSPAFNVKLSSILFASVAFNEDVKTSDLTPVSESKAIRWKLTLLDDQKTVRVTDGKSVTRTDHNGNTTITVPYTYTDSNTANAVTRISVMITDKEYTTKGAQVLYYGKLADAATTSGGITGDISGTGTFDLPSEYADKSCGRDYYVYLIAEDVNGDEETDYASTPVQIRIPAALHTVNVANGTLSDGNTTGEYAEGDTVTITADTAPTGEQFKEWTVESGTVTLADSTSETTTFVMPGEAVSVKAVYEAIPVTEYTITATAGANGSISPAGAVKVAAGDSRIFTFGADSGYVIDSLKVDGATVTANGNSYTFNSVDSDHTIEVTFKQETGSAAVVYQILNGADGSWTVGSSEGLSIRGDGAFSKFTGVEVDGKLLDRSNYTAEEGSTIITLKADYLNTLSVGKHTIEILWSVGSAGTAFTINAKVSGDVTGTTNNNSTANNNSTSNDNSASNDNSTVSGEDTGNAVAPKTGDFTQGVWLPVLMLGIGLILILAGWKEKKNLNILRK